LAIFFRDEEKKVKEVEGLSESILPSKSVDMIIGWAISHHLKHNVGHAAPALQAITSGGEAEAEQKGKEPAAEEAERETQGTMPG
jgi:hypothetical protein